jgi:molecular chaperone GrpE
MGIQNHHQDETSRNAVANAQQSGADEPLASARVDGSSAARSTAAGGAGSAESPFPEPASAQHVAENTQDTDTGEPPDVELARIEDRWRRAAADLDNLRKRFAREVSREREAERSRVARAWLPVLDNIELALGHAEGEWSALIEGIHAVRDQAVEVLAWLGYPRHDEAGVPFNPQWHEVVGVVDAPDVPPGTVVRVVRPGYGEGERLLRPASVMVSRQEG